MNGERGRFSTSFRIACVALVAIGLAAVSIRGIAQETNAPAKPSAPAVRPQPRTAPAQPRPPAQAQAQPQPAAQPQSAQSNAEVVVTLVRMTLIALHQANVTGNYTVLRDLAAPDFRDKNTAADLSRIFAPVRDSHVDLSRVVLLNPQISRAQLNHDNILDIAGALATQPPVQFELQFRPVGQVWRLEKIAIAPVQAAVAPQAQTPPPPAQPQAAKAPARRRHAAKPKPAAPPSPPAAPPAAAPAPAPAEQPEQ